MNNSKKIRVFILSVLFIIILLSINSYRVIYLTDFINEEDFLSLNVIKQDVHKINTNQIIIEDDEKIEEINNYLREHKVRRSLRWGSGVKFEGNMVYYLDFTTGPGRRNYMIQLLSDEYVLVQIPYTDKNRVFKYIGKPIDLNYLEALFESLAED